MPGYMRRPIHRHAPVAPSRRATLGELQRLSPSASLALARQSVQASPQRPPSARKWASRLIPPALMLAVLTGGYALASALTGGQPF